MIASTASSSSAAVHKIMRSSDFRWAVGGWFLFIAENAILSENRTQIIAFLDNDDESYHKIYGICSTLATASIAYSYYKLKNLQKLVPSAGNSSFPQLSTARLGGSWAFLSLGLIMASQALPKMQVPVDTKFQVRCPFDFTDRRNESKDSAKLEGLERITRHPGLWSLALISAGQALTVSHPPLRWWWYGPTAVAWLGGSHNDSRFRRGLGGTLDPLYDCQTSNVPFLALLSGSQGRVDKALVELLEEIKPLNAAIAVAVATLWVARKGRIRR